MNQFPIQLAKVQCPALREETLARGRLLDWLNARIHDRVILVLADAGYGKTTLLADFSRRTRLRTLWYRFEEDDRDWTAVLSHLVAAGREHDPAFAPTTASLLAEMSVGGPTREAVIETFLRELATVTEPGAVLILDDFHLVDESPDVRLIARELVARAPERTTIIFSSRRPPSIGLARLRASGEVAELGTDDLRFDAAETRQLFTETYGRALEQDVLDDVVKRTEGWAASLQLIHQALRDRSPSDIRRFIRGLSGADRELYDYLAEEVVGELPDDVQQFLMRTSILQSVTPNLAAVVSGLDGQDVTRLTATAERLTLLSRPPRAGQGPHRYHPLVREFLEARLRLNAGPEAVTELHRQVAEAAVAIDWRIAAHHYREAGDSDNVKSVLASALPEIMGNGQYTIAAEFAERVHDDASAPALALIRSRIELQRGDLERAANLALAVFESTQVGSESNDHALMNLLSTSFLGGNAEETVHYASLLATSTSSPHLRTIADGTRALVAASTTGRVDVVDERLRTIAELERGVHPHFFGVAMLNLAVVSALRDDPKSAIDQAEEAIEALEQTSSRLELAAALMAKANALAMVGNTEAARVESNRALSFGHTESTIEAAEIADSFDRPDDAVTLLERLSGKTSIDSNNRRLLAMVLARLHTRRGEAAEASIHVEGLLPGTDGTFVGHAVAVGLLAAYLASAQGRPEALESATLVRRAAQEQGVLAAARQALILEGLNRDDAGLSQAIRTVGAIAPWHVTYFSDLIARRLGALDDEALKIVRHAAGLHRDRWRFVLRGVVTQSGQQEGLVGARLLEEIGERSDVRRLRAFAKAHRRLSGAATLGRDLARRTADRVYVEDQGRVTIQVGSRVVAGTSIRRKVLALFCFLLSRPELAATRDQVLDALWPDLDPPDALNSLNQTVYFLRRVFEEEYVDDLSPGYLHHDPDVVWLDRDLIRSRSNDCRDLMRRLPPSPSPTEVQELVDLYKGRFAMDFEYEEWAAPYREWLHASFLEIVERAVARDLEVGQFDRGIALARRVLDIDSDAEQVEVSLLRLYRGSGAHSAAAEQYTHYASTMRDQLGLDPPPLEAV